MLVIAHFLSPDDFGVAATALAFSALVYVMPLTAMGDVLVAHPGTNRAPGTYGFAAQLDNGGSGNVRNRGFDSSRPSMVRCHIPPHRSAAFWRCWPCVR